MSVATRSHKDSRPLTVYEARHWAALALVPGGDFHREVVAALLGASKGEIPYEVRAPSQEGEPKGGGESSVGEAWRSAEKAASGVLPESPWYPTIREEMSALLRGEQHPTRPNRALELLQLYVELADILSPPISRTP